MKTKSRLEAIRELQRCGSLELSSDDELDISESISYTDCKAFYDDRKNCKFEFNSNRYEDSSSAVVGWKEILKLIKKNFERYPLVYVNAYAVDRRYVHPAEGGIYLDFGHPLASVPVYKKNNNVELMKAHLNEIFGPEYELNRHRSSVIGGENLEIYVEDHLAERFPTEPFVYE